MRRQMQHRVKFDDFLPWKVLYFAVHDRGHAAGAAAVDVDTVTDDEVTEFWNQCREIGRYVEDQFGSNKEPPVNFKRAILQGFFCDLIVRSAALPAAPPRKRAEFALRVTRCVLRYFGARLVSDGAAYRAAVRAITRALAQIQDPAKQLTALLKTVDIDGLFEFGEADWREIPRVLRWREEFVDQTRIPSQQVREVIARYRD